MNPSRVLPIEPPILLVPRTLPEGRRLRLAARAAATVAAIRWAEIRGARDAEASAWRRLVRQARLRMRLQFGPRRRGRHV